MNIKHARLKAYPDLNQKEFAKLIGVNPVLLNRWEKGKTTPKKSSLEKIEKVINQENI